MPVAIFIYNKIYALVFSFLVHVNLRHINVNFLKNNSRSLEVTLHGPLMIGSERDDLTVAGCYAHTRRDLPKCSKLPEKTAGPLNTPSPTRPFRSYRQSTGMGTPIRAYTRKNVLKKGLVQ